MSCNLQNRWQKFGLVLLVLIVAVNGYAGPRANVKKTALDRYVYKPDPNFKFKLVNTIKGEGHTTYILSLTSQQWRTEAEVDRPIWEHWLTIIQPDEVKTPTGLLFIEGGSNNGKAPGKPAAMFYDVAVNSHAVVSVLRMIPNEPLIFKDDNKSRTEDSIIAYTAEKFFKTGDETWPLRLPMTKSAVRALDAVTAFCASDEGGKAKTSVNNFVVSGGSKRGWTAWTTAVVDDRVIALVPFVIDVLNNEKSMDHHFRAYGFWAPAVGDYKPVFNSWLGTPQNKALVKIEDPYEYRDRLTMPKMIVNSTGDQFFAPDSSQFYFADLKGEKYLRYVPNTNHGLDKSDAAISLGAFFDSIVANRPRPQYAWKFKADGSIEVRTKDKPTEVKLWQATNPKARDFRLEAIGPAYKSSPLTAVKDGVYVAQMPKPAQGFTAYFIELTFANSGKYPLKYTTAVRIAPDVLPFPSPVRTSAK